MHGDWPHEEIATASSAIPGMKARSLVRSHAEVEDYLLHSLRGSGSVFPLHQRLLGISSKHRVAALYLDIGDIAVGKHGRFCDNACLKVAVPEEVRIVRFNPDNDLAGGLDGRLGDERAWVNRQE